MSLTAEGRGAADRLIGASIPSTCLNPLLREAIIIFGAELGRGDH
jgi:hypothetical protein